MSATRLPKGVLPLLILVVGVLGAVAMMKMRPSAPKRPAMTRHPVVNVHRVTDDVPVVRVEGHGAVTARRRITLVPQVSGVVVETPPSLQAGGSFAEGDVLLRVDDADYRLAVESARAQVARQRLNLATAEQEAQIARREWERVQEEQGGTVRVRPNPLVLHGPQLELAQAELASAEAALAQAELNLDRCTLRAPFDGRVVDESVDAGQYIRAGNPVATIYATDVAEVSVPLQDADLAFFDAPAPDGTGGAGAELAASFAGREHVWRGRVVRLSSALDERTRLVDAVVAVEDAYLPDGDRPGLIDGLYVEVRIDGHALDGMLSLPRSAVRAGDRVWIVDAEGRLRIRDVDVVRAEGETAIVSAGLAPGDEVVVSQLDIVSDGMIVRVAGRPGPGAGGAGAAAGGGS